MSQRYFLLTYGCQMNKSDSERIAGFLHKKGYKKALKMDKADLIVVNMCSVRQSAVDRVYGKIKDFAKLKVKNEKLKIILMGCILKEDRKKFAEYFDCILNIKDLPRWHCFGCPEVQHQDIDHFKIQPKYGYSPIAYVPISTGCRNFCSYCVVPYTRGTEVCRPADEIIDEVKKLVKKGYKEIWLLGQNVNSYTSRIISEFENEYKRINSQKLADNSLKLAMSNKINFAKLLKMINEISGDFSIHFTSPHPKNFSLELIDVIACGEKIAKEIHLPVQSGNNEILKKMNRNYTVKEYKNLVKKIRRKIPNVSFSTDVIVGFPGETEKQFENTINVLKEIGFRQAYVAAYSPRPGTAAARIKDNVSSFEKKRRKRIILEMFESKNKASHKTK